MIFADEPTGALDPYTAEGVLRLLRQAADGTTVIIVTHEPQVTRFCDQAVFLHAGRVERCWTRQSQRRSRRGWHALGTGQQRARGRR